MRTNIENIINRLKTIVSDIEIKKKNIFNPMSSFENNTHLIKVVNETNKILLTLSNEIVNIYLRYNIYPPKSHLIHFKIKEIPNINN